MKKLTKISSVLLLIFTLFSNSILKAQTEAIATETFKVWGNCEMCKTTIEKSLKKVVGIKSAKWNVETKMITVKFDTRRPTSQTRSRALSVSRRASHAF